VTITGSVGVLNSPVSLAGSSAVRTFTASIGPSPLAFGNWATGTTSNTLAVNVLNTGNSALTGFTYSFGGGTPQPFSRNGGTCPTTATATLAVGASCTILVQFAPTAPAAVYSRTLTVAATGATMTPASVTLTGTGVAARATVLISPNPLTITLPSTGTTAGSAVSTVTLTNTAPLGTGASMTVTSAAASGGTLFTYLWTSGALAGPDTCTGATLAPQQSCSVSVRFTNIFSARGTTVRAGTITFTDNGAASPQVGVLNGIASQAVVVFRNGTTDPTCLAGANITTLAWGTAATPLTACVVNTGNGDLNITSETIANVAPSTQFSSGTQLATACSPGTTVPAGGFCTVVISRARPAAGAVSGSLTSTDTGAAAGTQTLTLTGL
jgi:hypothetical protein